VAGNVKEGSGVEKAAAVKWLTAFEWVLAPRTADPPRRHYSEVPG
jgi:hypothetical protein